MNITIREQKKSNPFWVDETGTAIPYKETTPVERVFENTTAKVATKALKLHKQLAEFKEFIRGACETAIELFRKEYKGKKKVFKGNYTLFNFDRSIKVEISVSQPIRFDDLTIDMAKERLEEFLKEGISAKNHFIKEMVLDAFKNQNGKLDVKRVLGLRRYSDRIKDQKYAEAMTLIDKAIRRPDTATYFRIWIREPNGKYRNIDLNIATITD